MENIVIGSCRLNLIIVRSGRRTVKIRVTAADCLEVAAPHRLPVGEIVRLLRQKEKWITAQLARRAREAASPVNAAVEPGAELLFLGRARRLTVLIGRTSRAAVSLDGDRLFIHLPSPPQPGNRRRWRQASNAGTGKKPARS